MKLSCAAACAAVVLMLLPGISAPAAGNPRPKTVVIRMTARKRKLNPEAIRVRQGEHVRLIVTSLDGKRELKLEDFSVDQILLRGDPSIIEFTASKAGTFTFQCLALRGHGLKKLKGKLIVEPQP